MIITPETFTLSQAKGFLTFEGVNGAGKSTLLRSASGHLQQKGHTIVETFEPGEGAFGKKIREIVLQQDNHALHPLSELFLFAADRAEHVHHYIQPALRENKVVLCDRYLYSTVAFQGFGRKLPLNLIDQINTAATDGLVPDLVILIDLDPKEGLRRTSQRKEGKDSFEDEEILFHERLRQGFLEIAETRPEPFLILDGMQSPERLFAELQPLLDSFSPAGL